MEKCRILTLLICFFLGPRVLSAQNGCDVTVNAGTDVTFCQGNQTHNLSAQITGDYLDLSWEPAAGLSNPLSPTPQATVNNTTTYTITVRSRSSLNLIQNGDFSQGDSGFTSDYIYGTGGSLGLLTAEGQYAIDDSPRKTHRRFADCSDHTTGNGNMMIVNASGKEDNFWCQSVTVNAETSYDFSAWVTSVADQNPAQLQFSIDGDLLGSQFNASTNLCTWQEFSSQWTAPASATVEICVVNVNLTPAGNDFAIDDIAFQEICLATDSITLNVAQLNTDWDVPATICQNENVILLDDWLQPSATTGGIWTLDGTVIQSLDPAKITPAQYVLRYTVTQESCELFNEQLIEVLATPYPGAPGPNLRFCQGEEANILLADQLQGQDLGGIWAETSPIPSPSNSFDPLTASVQVATLPAGYFTFNYSVGANSPCGISENQVSITIDPIPAVNLGEDRALGCDDPTITLVPNEPQSADLSYQWTDQSGTVIGSAIQLNVDQAGTYTLEVINTNTTCQNQDQISIGDNLNNVSATVNSFPSSCFDSKDGIIRIENASGGTEPYLFSLNSSPFVATPEFGNLSPGNYQVSIMDATGCTIMIDTVVNAPSELQVEILIDDAAITIGDSVELEVVVNNRVDQIEWRPNPDNCTNCQKITVAPLQSTIYAVQVIDANGCTASAQLPILVKRNIDIFVPNAFSPNEDGVNDLFFVNAAQGIRIVNLQIADRWGNIVFQRNDLTPNDPGQAWDGRINGRLIPSGIVVYSLEAELANGERIIQSGELAVVY